MLFTIDAVFHEHRRGPMTEAYENAVSELVRVVCHSEHTYLYAQALLHVMCEEVCLVQSVIFNSMPYFRQDYASVK